MLVCRFWRDVACATPSLWRAVDVGEQLQWLRLCLSRSAGCTMDIAFHGHETREVLAELLAPHSHRIRTLRIFCVSKSFLDSVRALPYGDMLALETFALEVVTCNSDTIQAGNDVVLQLSSVHHPRLRSITLSNTAIPRDPQLYAKLHTLNLGGSICGRGLTFGQFLDLLSATMHLRTLSLTDVLDHLTSRTSIQLLEAR